jgi:hypothetical protein
MGLGGFRGSAGLRERFKQLMKELSGPGAGQIPLIHAPSNVFLDVDNYLPPPSHSLVSPSTISTTPSSSTSEG